MTADMVELGRRAVACRGWRWMAGMLDDDGERYQWRHENRQAEALRETSDGGVGWVEPDRATPDLTDPATLGAVQYGILAPLGVWIEVAIRPSGGIVYRHVTIGSAGSWHDHPAKALVAALECAP